MRCDVCGARVHCDACDDVPPTPAPSLKVLADAVMEAANRAFGWHLDSEYFDDAKSEYDAAVAAYRAESPAPVAKASVYLRKGQA